MRRGWLLVLAGVLLGCGRDYYRRDADRETYSAIVERKTNPLWAVPDVSIDPPRQSRLHDPYDPDCPPMPPDDVAAHEYMRCADGHKGYKHWYADGLAEGIESPQWREYLGLDPTGVLELNPDRAVEIGLRHSREYQTALEDLYGISLGLTLNRYEFAVQWFGGNDTTYRHFGSSSLPNESNTLTTDTNVGFERALTTGGQLLVNFANSFVWEYTGPNRNTVSSNILIDFIQPLLRGAGREIRMERLTQGERNLLYAVRDFARFRKEFYVGLTTRRDGYLSLLLQVQNIRDLEENLERVEQNLRLHEALYANGNISSIQVDQAFQSYQAAQLSLLQARTGLETALDEYKTLLGLPPRVPVKLNDNLLSPFQLNDPGLTTLQEELDQFLKKILQLETPPPLTELQSYFGKLKSFHDRLEKLSQQLSDELSGWEKKISTSKKDAAAVERERAALLSLQKQHVELRQDLREQAVETATAEVALAENRRKEGHEALDGQARKEMDLAAQLFVIQTQVRVYLIELRPIEWQLQPALEFALSNRLDLMNQRGRVVDAWRQIKVAADGLEADFDVVVGADIGTEADASNPFDFAASNSSYRVGFRFDSPLNRKAERNIYRTALVNYQRSRRTYMAVTDGIEKAIRRDLRQLETQRLSFEIARQSLIAAARQVERTREELLKIAQLSDSSSTQDILNALRDLLQAKTALIGSWVGYEAGRIQLLLDLEALQLDERGLYHDEPNTTALDPRGTVQPAGGISSLPRPGIGEIGDALFGQRPADPTASHNAVESRGKRLAHRGPGLGRRPLAERQPQ